MLDHFTIFTKSGIVLWSYTQAKLKGSPIDNLVRTVLLEERGGENSINLDLYTLKWTFANEFELIFVVVYQKIIQLLYIDELLEAVKRTFTEQYKEALQNVKSKTTFDYDFTDLFVKILNSLEKKSFKEKQDRKEKGPRSFSQTAKGKEVLKDKKDEKPDSKPKKPESADNSSDESNTNNTLANSLTASAGSDNGNSASENNHGDDDPERTIRENIEKLKLKKLGKGKKSSSFKGSATPSAPTAPPKRGGRKWDDTTSKDDANSLDFSNKFNTTPSDNTPTSPTNSRKNDVVQKVDLDQWGTNNDEEEDEIEEPEEPEEDILKQTKKPAQAQSGGFMNFLKGLAGNKPLEASDLEPVLAQFKQHLISKNVASEIAEKLCESVSVSLQGKKLGSFQGVKSTVKAAIEEALVRILTPKKNIDILRDALEAKAAKRPYTIVFVGVNGVGKSTNLAKVCCWLQQNNLTVMLAACDTFRSGAVEQLKVHATRLNVEIFERGYRSEPTAIALEAIRYAKQNNVDAVLIDTAGRMQDNEPLMKALSKLVNTVKPDLVLFVGEALVGNDAVDQLTKYNQALMDLSKDAQPRLIDGIILTKFDTIDDKVGAAISMVYTTGQPIVFLGVGQHYTDLRRMNVTVVTKALLKGA